MQAVTGILYTLRRPIVEDRWNRNRSSALPTNELDPKQQHKDWKHKSKGNLGTSVTQVLSKVRQNSNRSNKQDGSRSQWILSTSCKSITFDSDLTAISQQDTQTSSGLSSMEGNSDPTTLSRATTDSSSARYNKTSTVDPSLRKGGPIGTSVTQVLSKVRQNSNSSNGQYGKKSQWIHSTSCKRITFESNPTDAFEEDVYTGAGSLPLDFCNNPSSTR